MNITKDTTLPLPPDGIFHCTTINIAVGATLTWKRNGLNTPAYLLATGDINISGIIDVSGQAGSSSNGGLGGPGGYKGGAPIATSDDTLGNGHGPGGGTISPLSLASSLSYENSKLIPLIGGSGGAAWYLGLVGVGGCGAIHVCSSKKVFLSGSIRAMGKSYSTRYGCTGLGGSIRIFAPAFLPTDAASVDAGAQNANHGRIRIDFLEHSGLIIGPKIMNGAFSWGANMVTFPFGTPRLDIVSACNLEISIRSPSRLETELPASAISSQTITVPATDFSVPISVSVQVVPDHAISKTFSAIVEMVTHPADVTIPITIVPGMTNHIYA
jgi:hypothetical protein